MLSSFFVFLEPVVRTITAHHMGMRDMDLLIFPRCLSAHLTPDLHIPHTEHNVLALKILTNLCWVSEQTEDSEFLWTKVASTYNETLNETSSDNPLWFLGSGRMSWHALYSWFFRNFPSGLSALLEAALSHSILIANIVTNHVNLCLYSTVKRYLQSLKAHVLRHTKPSG